MATRSLSPLPVAVGSTKSPANPEKKARESSGKAAPTSSRLELAKDAHGMPFKHRRREGPGNSPGGGMNQPLNRVIRPRASVWGVSSAKRIGFPCQLLLDASSNP